MKLGFFVLLMAVMGLVKPKAFAQETPLYTTTYIAVAGPAPGAGMMGHVFFVFSAQPKQFINATAYQYAVKFPDNFEFSLSEAMKLGSYPFVVTQFSAWSFIKQYNQEGRFVQLFQLNFSKQQTQQLLSQLEADRIQRERFPQYDYSISENNCATKIYDAVNTILGKTEISYSTPQQSVITFDFIRPNRVALSVPLSAAPNLAKHPLVVDIVKFRSQEMIHFENTVAGALELEKLMQKCALSKELQAYFIRIFGNHKIRETKSFLNFFQKRLRSCVEAGKAEKLDYNFILDFLIYDSESKEFEALAKEFYLP